MGFRAPSSRDVLTLGGRKTNCNYSELVGDQHKLIRCCSVPGTARNAKVMTVKCSISQKRKPPFHPKIKDQLSYIETAQRKKNAKKVCEQSTIGHLFIILPGG